MASYEINSNPSFIPSPWGKKITKAQEVLSSGREISLAKGTTEPDYIRKVYEVSDPKPIRENFPFLDRDDKDRVYDPGIADKYVFKNMGSVEQFKTDARANLKTIVQLGKSLGLVTELDSKRGVEVLSSSNLIDKFISKGPKSLSVSETERISNEDVRFLLSNQDIALKACVVRTVLPAWWIVSYRGRKSAHASPLKQAVDVLVAVLHTVEKTPAYKQKLDQVLSSQGDPLDTAVGFPLYQSTVDDKMNPIAKLEVLHQYKNLVKAGGRDWDKLKEVMKDRGRTNFQKQFLFAIAPIRRLQPGYKVQHVWNRSMTGLRLQFDVQGMATNRVAWAASYLLNLLLSPIQSRWKAARMVIPGLFHDGSSRREMLHAMQTTPPYFIESDFKNWDRSIPNDIMSYFFHQYTKSLRNSKYWFGVLSQTHRNIPLVWGDQSPNLRGNGWAFEVDVLGLLSGLKITSEVGTFMNLIINIAGWIATGAMTKEDAYAYLINKSNSVIPKVLIQSDDTLLCAANLTDLHKLSVSFMTGCSYAGIVPELQLGDKFLMRHLSRGKDTPVITRIWQNTLSNEQPVDDPLIMIIGFLMRTEGILGQRTFDPFGVGHVRKTSEIETKYSLQVLKSIRGFASTASESIPELVQCIDSLIGAGNRMGSEKMNSSDVETINSLRVKFLKLLAAREARDFLRQADANKQFATMIYQLHKDQFSPTSKWRLDELMASNSAVKGIVESLVNKEHAFYEFAMKQIGETPGI